MNTKSLLASLAVLNLLAACATGAPGEAKSQAAPAAATETADAAREEAARSAALLEKEKQLKASIKKADDAKRSDEALARDLGELARVYMDTGRPFDAEASYQRALSVHETVSGAESLQTAGALEDLGMFYRFQGKATMAEPLYKRALEINEKVHGEKDPKVLPALEKYIDLLKELNLRNQAIRLEARVRFIKAHEGQ